jgi:hypothetical protein
MMSTTPEIVMHFADLESANNRMKWLSATLEKIGIRLITEMFFDEISGNDSPITKVIKATRTKENRAIMKKIKWNPPYNTNLEDVYVLGGRLFWEMSPNL